MTPAPGWQSGSVTGVQLSPTHVLAAQPAHWTSARKRALGCAAVYTARVGLTLPERYRKRERKAQEEYTQLGTGMGRQQRQREEMPADPQTTPRPGGRPQSPVRGTWLST